MQRTALCICCQLLRKLNRKEFCPDCATCLHCQHRRTVHRRGLCSVCRDDPQIRVLYRRGFHWTPEWEQHLRAKTAEVQRCLRAQKRKHRYPPAS